jgi:catecholate siderophore receptor
MGTTGGAINQTQKTAHLGDKYDFEASGGSGPFGRTVIDLNKQIDATTAVRIVGMYTEQDIVDRDHVYNDRYGILGSIGFGLGTDETLTLNYLYQSGKRKPDMGVPIATPPAAYQSRWGSLGRPVTEQPGVSRSNYYGKDTDLDDYDVNMFTARYKKEVNDWLTITNDTRIAGYNRYFAQTVTQCNATNNADNGGSSCAANLFDGDPATVPVYGFGGPAGFDQDIWGMENISTAIARFQTGALRHELVGGLDLFYQHDERTQLANYRADGTAGTGTKTPGTVYDPNYDSQDPSFPNGGYVVERNERSRKKSSASDIAAFVSDRVWLTDQFSVLGGVRWDNYSAKYRTTDSSSGEWTGCTPPGTGGNTGTSETCASDLDSRTSFTSPKASVIWEPTANQTYYATWAVSYSDIAGQFISNDNNSITNETLEPSRNELYEGGAKISLLDGKLGLTAAIYQVTKDNAKQEDPTSGEIVATGERQRVRGIDLGVTGQVTDAWTVQVAYSYMDSEIIASASDATVIGNKVAFVPENAVSFWTTYDLTRHLLPTVPGTLLVGGGVTYQDETFANSANSAIIPEYFTFDALVSYQYKNYRFALNGYNLTDELNYSGGFGNRAVVGPGRAFTFTIGATF